MNHYRTLTMVVEIPDDSDLSGPGYAIAIARQTLESKGFTCVRLRNAPNETGLLPSDEDDDA